MPPTLLQPQVDSLNYILYDAFLLIRNYPSALSGDVGDMLHEVPLLLNPNHQRRFRFDYLIGRAQHVLTTHQSSSVEHAQQYVAFTLRTIDRLKQAEAMESYHERMTRLSYPS